MRASASSHRAPDTSHCSGASSTPSRRRAWSTTAASPRARTSSMMARTAVAVSGSAAAPRVGRYGASTSNGGARSRVTTGYVPASMSGSATESLGLRLAALVALVLANAFFVAAEFALVAARRTRIEALVRRGDRKAKTVQTALQDLYRQLSAAQLGITVASILLGYVAEDTVAHAFRDWFAALPPALDFLTRGGLASVLAVAAISFLHVVFGEQAPKAWAITYPERDRKSTRLNSSHLVISYAVFCLKKKKKNM